MMASTPGLIRCWLEPGACLGQAFLEPSAARQPTLDVSLALQRALGQGARAVQASRLRRASVLPPPREPTLFCLGAIKEGCGAVVAVESRRQLGNSGVATRTPPAPPLTSYNSVSTHPCHFQPSIQISSDALYLFPRLGTLLPFLPSGACFCYSTGW